MATQIPKRPFDEQNVTKRAELDDQDIVDDALIIRLG